MSIRIKILAAAVRERTFSIPDLAEAANASVATVRSVLRRSPESWFVQDKQKRKGRRGAPTISYSLTSVGRDEIEQYLREASLSLVHNLPGGNPGEEEDEEAGIFIGAANEYIRRAEVRLDEGRIEPVTGLLDQAKLAFEAASKSALSKEELLAILAGQQRLLGLERKLRFHKPTAWLPNSMTRDENNTAGSFSVSAAITSAVMGPSRLGEFALKLPEIPRREGRFGIIGSGVASSESIGYQFRFQEAEHLKGLLLNVRWLYNVAFERYLANSQPLAILGAIGDQLSLWDNAAPSSPTRYCDEFRNSCYSNAKAGWRVTSADVFDVDERTNEEHVRAVDLFAYEHVFPSYGTDIDYATRIANIGFRERSSFQRLRDDISRLFHRRLRSAISKVESVNNIVSTQNDFCVVIVSQKTSAAREVAAFVDASLQALVAGSNGIKTMNLDEMWNDAALSMAYAPLVLFAIDSSSNSGKRSSSHSMRDIFERVSSHNPVVVFDASSSIEVAEAVKTTSAAYVSHATALTAVDLFKCLDETVGPYNSTGTTQP
ncbi:hypothetical protein [Burkholderia sp. Se-20378]|uniref:hypothetical protein n=1 Tax=Burkholderia sp. Se-20378 TaxID=2703899 RepID=UPI001981A277|nr:hypothetical protein [Burkholderia sp. Se-20378]MBN3769788.1 hypothetical protein [Burkholderia sp. Se-20378]